MKYKYPFDYAVKNHILIGVGLAIWIFVFLYFTEPLDVHEFGATEKLIYLPIYGLVGALAYLIILPFQSFLYRSNRENWFIQSEFLFTLLFVVFGLLVTRSVYLYVIIAGEPNPYSLWYFITSIFLPAISTILPIVLIGRFALGKYREKKIEDSKIEITGDGTYEGLRLEFKELIAVKADDNYVEVFFEQGAVLKKQLIRNKLSVVAHELPELLKTHRSYLVNPIHFRQWNNQNGKLSMYLSHEIEVPVSRTFTTSVKEAIQLATK
ncbi:LytTR family DNA-binding domain-containing protein [Patiriisocius hiemis]|uniref:LytTR family DNA-binding domain-containing protein n=1 Tax=Patiriisocius hiemis TaxID=3075604 RepID=A0ABU2YAS7_9FLAO|nr:LytTR family DNA-binding domain-containing protein [Constantimarinum sp. W242]MDT0554951.1 LytTR family DNA-binding domain-containing protein [Constantimarinum sp. W242]